MLVRLLPHDLAAHGLVPVFERIEYDGVEKKRAGIQEILASREDYINIKTVKLEMLASKSEDDRVRVQADDATPIAALTEKPSDSPSAKSHQ